MRKRKRKARKKAQLKRMTMITLAILYFVCLWTWFLHDGVETSILHEDSLHLEVQATGVFVRSEIPIKANESGVFIPNVNNGDRVPSDFLIGVILDPAYQQTLKKIVSLENNIIRRIASDNPTRLDVKDFSSNIHSEAKKLSALSHNNSLEGVNQVKMALEKMLFQRNKEIFEELDSRIHLKSDQEELESLRRIIKSNEKPVSSDLSGVVVWNYDGFEEKYNPNNLKNLDIASLKPDTTYGHTNKVELKSIFSKTSRE